MAKVTIVVPDGVVGVDGEFRKVNLDDIDPAIHAVQWDGSAGHVEYSDHIDDLDGFADFQKYVDRWNLLTPPADPRPTEIQMAQAEVDALRLDAVAEVEAARIEALVVEQAAAIGGSQKAKAYVKAKAQLDALATKLGIAP